MALGPPGSAAPLADNAPRVPPPQPAGSKRTTEVTCENQNSSCTPTGAQPRGSDGARPLVRAGSIDDDERTLDEIRAWMIEWLLTFKGVFGPVLDEVATEFG